MSLRICLTGLIVDASRAIVRTGGPTGPGGRLSGSYLRRLSGDNSSDHYSYLRRLSKGNFVGPYLRRLSGDNSQNIRRSKIGQNPDRIYYFILPKVCQVQGQILHMTAPKGRGVERGVEPIRQHLKGIRSVWVLSCSDLPAGVLNTPFRPPMYFIMF